MKLGNKEVEGKDVYFYVLRQLISIAFFYLFAYFLGLLNRFYKFDDMFTSAFVKQILFLSFMGIIFELVGYLAAFLFLNLIFKRILMDNFLRLKDVIRDPIQRTFSILISSLLSALFISIGFLFLIADNLFDQTDIYTLLASYIVLKIISLVITWATVRIVF